MVTLRPTFHKIVCKFGILAACFVDVLCERDMNGERGKNHIFRRAFSFIIYKDEDKNSLGREWRRVTRPRPDFQSAIRLIQD